MGHKSANMNRTQKAAINYKKKKKNQGTCEEFQNFKSSCSLVFYRIADLNIFRKLTGKKHLPRNPLQSKVSSSRP